MAESSTLARPYANAVFRLARERDELPHWGRMLATLSGIVADERVASRLAEPTLTAEARAGLVEALAGDEIDARAHALVRLMARNDRLALMPSVAEAFDAMRAEAESTLDVEIKTAFALSDAQISSLSERLQQRFGRAVEMDIWIDPGLIGGIQVRAGDTVIDGSVKGRLARLQEQLQRQ